MSLIDGLLKEWKDFRDKESGKVEAQLKYGYRSYYKKNLKNWIVDGLTFWKFVQKILPMHALEVKRRFLAACANEKETTMFVKIVAIVECLPISVWRKILWKYNVDFMSFESFLRRLDAKQAGEIIENYKDLFERNKVPRVFGKWERFFKRITVEKLLSESQSPRHYSSKGAMSYNLLGLDFGFNAYPKGVADDTKVVEISPLKFLSVKNHADDFIVKQKEDGGKYWWLYCACRSNYVWKPNKKVELKTHICPGFWYTLLIHLWFWVVSPIFAARFAGIVLSGGWHQTSWLEIILTALPAWLTPLWLLCAAAKFLVLRIVELACIIEDSLGSLSKRAEDVIGGIGRILLLLVALFVAGVITYWFFNFLNPTFGALYSIVVIAVFYLYIGCTVGYKEEESDNVEDLAGIYDMPLYFSLPILAGIVGAFFKTRYEIQNLFILVSVTTWRFISYVAIQIFQLAIQSFQWLMWLIPWLAKWIITGLGYLLGFILFVSWEFISLIWEIVMMMGWLSLVMALPAAFYLAILYLPRLISEEKIERFFDVLSRIIGYSAGVAFVGAIVVSLWLQARIGMGLLLVASLIIAYGMVVALFFLWMMSYESNPRVEKTTYVVRAAFNKPNRRIRRLLLNNQWFQSLDEQEKINQIHRARRLIANIQNCIDDTTDEKKFCIIDMILPVMDEEVLKRLEQYLQQFLELPICVQNKFGCLEVIEKIIRGYDFKTALEDFLRKEKERQEKSEKTKRVLSKIFYPFVYPFILISRAFVWVVKTIVLIIKKTIEYTKTLYRLYELFNKRCPFVQKPKPLQIED